jgi:site-specific DNA recombinase
VEALGITEAALVQDLFQRMAHGSSSVIEACRLNALGVPTTRYYGTGTRREGGKKWHPGPIAGMIANPTYRGTHVLQSRYGAIEREVPALVDAVLWEQANAQIKRNQKLPKANATRVYLLRGLITCGQCGSAYVGQVKPYRSGNQMIYYRCSGRSLSRVPGRQVRCHARVINATWLEAEIWAHCRAFILNPGEALAEAQQQLHDWTAQVAQIEIHRDGYLRALQEKHTERERVMTLFRRGRVTLHEAEAELDAIAKEETALRQQLSAIEAQKALAEAFESHLTDASLLLTRLQTHLAQVEAENDIATKRQVIEYLVRGIHIDTPEGEKPGNPYVTVTYTFSQECVASSSRRWPGSRPPPQRG